ncbi:PSD1 and planctomycete cytochrome C domain-containing protein [Stieleria varia]|uniref:Planctomycete cytochrome C n=1 Tax=Stieleria varia TaxID=2528005 RepID=A0A5C6A3F2_9BACT|nr:PSD1 and planctomycete cytochrome C domain-containing protein [Stieleria varia]TWT93788.1 Planctomycete cytochrome C [Stieleria varia]
MLFTESHPSTRFDHSDCQRSVFSIAASRFVCTALAWFAIPLTGTVLQAEEKSAQNPGKPPADAKHSREAIDFFESNVRPLLVEHCYECHSVESGESSGDLRLDSAAALLRGGSMGPGLVPGQPEKSLILRAVRYNDRKLQMPPSDKLDDESIEVLRKWIEMGAPDPREDTATDQPANESQTNWTEHWAFQIPQRARIDDSNASGDQHVDVIDTLAATRASQAGLQRADVASDETLIHRLYFDLTGLPPTTEQVQAFVSSTHPDKYERLIDTLLASPEYAERFARHWMDVARYSDTVGYALGGKERRIQGSQRYRDWLVKAFAEDMPYDEMIRLQLAADRLDGDNTNGNLDAMGFLTIGRRFLNNLDVIDDRIDVVSRGLLGLTVACARCHDHKFDPIPTADYYSLFGVMNSSEWKQDGPSPLMMVDREKPGDHPILLRGQQGSRGPIAPRQYLTALRKPDEQRFTDGSGRLELALRIADSENPLTSRVMVNRVWAHLIGRPLVDTPSDFGVRTAPPAIPEVLDDLAAEFSTHWSIKRLVKRIVMTRVYRQSVHTAAENLSKDPDNQLLARANRKRRDFESLRDSMLDVCGFLDQSLGGEPVEITLPTLTPRRTIYAMIDRQNLPSLFRTFDFANPDAHAPKRYFTTVPQQALYLLNSDQTGELARLAAKHSREQVGSEAQEPLIDALFRSILSRPPTKPELQICVEFLSRPARPSVAEYRSTLAWQYGTSPTDDDVRPTDFTPFAVFKDSRWQAANEFPAKSAMGHAFLSRDAGHPANRDAVIRRWIAPADGELRLSGLMGHRSDNGDGFRAAIWVGKNRVFLETQKMNNRPYGPLTTTVAKGEAVDFVADPGESASHDSFFWRAQISMTATDGRLFEADSEADFAAPKDANSVEPLDRFAQLAQILLLSNEFAFVD